MTEYWKSIPKKFCDLCKCWITENKASVEFHEKGVRHKANVQQRIRDAREKGKTSQSTKTATDQDMRKIEAAALKSFEKDVTTNPSLASQYGDAKSTYAAAVASAAAAAAKKAKELPSVPVQSPPTGSYDSLPSFGSAQNKPHKESLKRTLGQERAMEAVSVIRKKQAVEAASKKWREAKADDGYSFFWHAETMDSRWDPPPEGYMSLAEQLEVDDITEDIVIPALRTKPLPPALGDRSGLGTWTTVAVTEEVPDIDYNTPVKSSTGDVADDIFYRMAEEDSRVQFRTKTVTTLGVDEGGDTSFRTRRKGGDNKKQVKKREDD